MESFSITPGVKFKLKDQEFLIRKILGEDVELTNLSYGDQVEIYSQIELLAAWDENRLLVNKEDLNDKEPIVVYDIDLLSDKEKDLMEKRFKVLKPIIHGEIKPSIFKSYVENLSEELKEVIGSLAGLYRWKRKWDETRDKRSLINTDRFTKRQYNTDARVVAIIKDLIRKDEKSGLSTTVRDKWIEMKERVKEHNEVCDEKLKLKPCSQTTVFRIVQDLTDSYAKDKARHGTVQAELNKNGATAEVEVDRPLQRIEIDWTPMDVMIVDAHTSKRKRFYLILAMDKYTDYPLGFYICPHEPDTRAIKQCLLHAMLPKVHLRKLYPKLKHDWLAYGVPETIVVDNAKVNESIDLEEVCGIIGIEVQYCPVKSGHIKGTVERTFSTLNSKLFHKLPGTTFSNPQEKSDYNSEKEACITLKYLYELIHLTLIELVANDISPDLGATPAQLWQEGLRETRVHRTLPYKKEHLKLLLATGVDTRKITNKGIEIQGQFYQSLRLQSVFDRKKRTLDETEVRIRFDTADMRVVYVWDDLENQYFEVYPTRNSLRRKGIDANYPVHYEQLHAYSYNNDKAYRDFDTTNIAQANRGIDAIVQESRKTLKVLEELTDDERAKHFAEDLSAIQTIYDAQLAPSDIDSIQLIEEVTSKDEKNSKTKAKGKKKARNIQIDTLQGNEKDSTANISSHIIYSDTIDESDIYETTSRKRA